MKKITDPIDRIIELVFEAQAGMTMNEFCLPGCRDEVRRRAGGAIEEGLKEWALACWDASPMHFEDNIKL